MKSVLISIQPKWCHRIIDGEKKIEVRKTKPKLATPFKVYIYCSAGSYDWRKDIWATAYFPPSGECTNMSQMVIGEFVCDCIIDIKPFGFDDIAEFEKQTCLTSADIVKYLNGFYGYGWHISDLKIYDKPRELSEFFTADKEAIRQCENREQSYYAFTDTGYIKNGFYCKKKDDWCFGGCKRKVLTRPPQSWMYVEELQNV